MSLWQRIKFALSRFMNGRYGADQLSRTLAFASLALLLVSYITRLGILYYLSLAGYGLAIFRMLSRNIEKRTRENDKYLAKTANIRTEIAQARNRFRNRKVYKYFKCPKCGVRLRLNRGVGEKTVTCKKCGQVFKQKA